jgi:hypothetical protein
MENVVNALASRPAIIYESNIAAIKTEVRPSASTDIRLDFVQVTLVASCKVIQTNNTLV